MNAPENFAAESVCVSPALSSGAMARASSKLQNAEGVATGRRTAYSDPGVSRDSVLLPALSPNGAGSAARSPDRVLHPARRETLDRPGIRRGSCLGHFRIRGLSMGPLAESLARSGAGTLLRIVQSRRVETDSRESLRRRHSSRLFLFHGMDRHRRGKMEWHSHPFRNGFAQPAKLESPIALEASIQEVAGAANFFAGERDPGFVVRRRGVFEVPRLFERPNFPGPNGSRQ